MKHADLTSLEKKCRRKVMQNLLTIGRKIGPRTRMIQIILDRGVVEGLRCMQDQQTSGWNDLYAHDLLGLSVEATVVESSEFRSLFEPDEIAKMEADLRKCGYQPKRINDK